VTTAPWVEVFGNARPVEIEIGPGRGDVLLAYAAARPDTNFFGIERLAPLAGVIVAAATARGLSNVQAIGGDARCILAVLLPDACVQAYHVYFPDPWPKTRQRKRRLFHGGTLAADMARTLVPGGVVHLASDLPGLVEQMATALRAAGLQQEGEAISPPAWPRTKYERRYAISGTHRTSLHRP